MNKLIQNILMIAIIMQQTIANSLSNTINEKSIFEAKSGNFNAY